MKCVCTIYYIYISNTYTYFIYQEEGKDHFYIWIYKKWKIKGYEAAKFFLNNEFECQGMRQWYTMALYMVYGLMWQCVVCHRDTLWHTIWSMVSCDNVLYVTVIHNGTLYGPCSHVTMSGMWPWYTMAHYMVHGLMWQCGGMWPWYTMAHYMVHVLMWHTLWHTIWSMFSCDNVGGMWTWYTMAHYMVHGLMWQCVVCDTLWHTIWSMVSCDNMWYVTMIHYGTLYGPCSHVTMCGMWPWYTMAHYMV